jgi:predicted ester cyclase
MTIERMVADGNKITAYWTTRGTHLGEFMLPDMPEGIPATGKAVEFTEAATFRIANGRLAEAWYAADRLTMMEQMGLGPSPVSDGDESYQGNSPVAKEVSHKASFRRFAEEAWNNGNLDVVDEVFAPEYVAHAANDAHSVYGPEGHKEFIAYFRQAFPDVHLTSGDLLAEDDLLVSRMKWQGTHMGNYMGIPPTGKKIAVDVTGINRFENGQVVEAWGVVDTLGMLQQLGVIADPDSETASSTAADPLREANKALIQRLIIEFWNDRVQEAADELVAPDCSCPTAPDLPDGPHGLKQLAHHMFTAFPDLRMVIDKIMADEEYVIAHCVKTGTHQGEFMEVAPTGKRATWNEMILSQIQGDKIKKLWFETDLLSMMQQLGAAPKLS